MPATEAELKTIRDKAEKAGVLPEFETLVVELIAREKRILDLDKLANERGAMLVAIAQEIGWRPDVTPAQLTHLPRQIKGLKTKLDAAGPNGDRAREVKSWVLGFLEGADIELPDPASEPEDVVRHVAFLLKARTNGKDGKGGKAPESGGGRKRRGK